MHIHAQNDNFSLNNLIIKEKVDFTACLPFLQ